MPLSNLGGNASDDYLGDGISEDVLDALSKLPGLTVIGRASSFQFRGRDVDATKVGRALNVRNLLSGTVQRAGDQLRINIELIDAASGKQPWSQKYDRSLKNLFALEDDISGAVSKALAVKLGTVAGQPLLADAHDFPAARRESERAVALNPGSAEAHMFLNNFLLQGEHDPAAARVEAHISQRLDPGNPWNHFIEIWGAMAADDLPALPVIARRTLAADSQCFYTADPLVYAYAMSGRWKECIARAAWGQAATGDVPDFAAAICYAHVGNPPRARQMLAQLQAAACTRYVDSSDIAAIDAVLRDKDAALTVLEQAYRDRSQLLLNFWFLPSFKSLHGEPRYVALYEKIYGTKLPVVDISR